VMINVHSGYKMFTTQEGYLSFTNNFVKNVGWAEVSTVSYDRGTGNIVQAAFAHGPAIRITDNVAINVLGESYPEDLVSMYRAGGTASDPMLVARNKFYGGGPSSSGGGIIMGDNGGSYQVVEDNILVNPGMYGLQVVGGNDLIMRNNRVYSDDQRDFTGVGLAVWRVHNGDKGTPPGECYGVTVESNEITFWKGPNYKGNGQPATLNSSWLPSTGSDGLSPNCGTIAGWSTNKFDTDGAQPANLDSSLWNPTWNTPSFLPDNPYFYSGGVQ